MLKYKALLNSELMDVAKILLEAKNLLSPAASQTREILAYSLAFTYVHKGRAVEAVFWLEKAKWAGNSVKQGDSVNGQGSYRICQNP